MLHDKHQLKTTGLGRFASFTAQKFNKLLLVCLDSICEFDEVVGTLIP
jgi:hypothetical protein